MGLETDNAKGISPPRDNAEMHSRINSLLTPKQQEIFGSIADGRVYLRDDVRVAVGYSNPTSTRWVKAISKMSSLGIVHYSKNDTDPKKKCMQLTEMCFPFSMQQPNDESAASFSVTVESTTDPALLDKPLKNIRVKVNTTSNKIMGVVGDPVLEEEAGYPHVSL